MAHSKTKHKSKSYEDFASESIIIAIERLSEFIDTTRTKKDWSINETMQFYSSLILLGNIIQSGIQSIEDTMLATRQRRLYPNRFMLRA